MPQVAIQTVHHHRHITRITSSNTGYRISLRKHEAGHLALNNTIKVPTTFTLVFWNYSSGSAGKLQLGCSVHHSHKRNICGSKDVSCNHLSLHSAKATALAENLFLYRFLWHVSTQTKTTRHHPITSVKAMNRQIHMLKMSRRMLTC